MALSLNVDNCPKCGAIYHKNLRNMCAACSKQIDDTLDLCQRFMWKHEKATTEQVHQGTGVAIDVIENFIKEDRLRPRLFVNLTYPCEKCGRGIREARICYVCASQFRDAFQPQKPAGTARPSGIGFRSHIQ